MEQQGLINSEASGLTEYAMSFVNRSQDFAAVSTRKSKVYGFTCSGKHFLLPLGVRAELISKPNFTPLPNAPEHCLGLASVRGSICPLYCLPFLWGEASENVTVVYGLVVGEGTNAVMLAIDDKPNSLDLAEYRERPVAHNGALIDACSTKLYDNGEKQWLMLDHLQLFRLLVNKTE